MIFKSNLYFDIVFIIIITFKNNIVLSAIALFK